MKIIHITGSFGRGGKEVLLLDYLKYTTANANINNVLLLTKGGDREEDLIRHNISFYKIRNKKTSVLYHLKFVFFLVREKAEIIHTHSIGFVVYAFICKLFRPKTKIFNTYHGFDYNYSKNTTRIIKLFIHSITKNIFVSKNQMNYYREKYGVRDNYEIVYNGIDIHKFEHEQGRLKDELKLNDKSILYGTVGNFWSYARDQKTIIKALARILPQNKHVFFAFIGDPNENYSSNYKECKLLVKELGIESQIFFLGKRNDIANILASLNLFIYASNYETFGIALVEAIIVGIPVVVNNYNTFLEITEDGKYVQIYETKDFENLAKILNSFIEDPTQFIKMSEKARSWARKKYSIANHANELVAIYNRSLNNGK